MRFVWKVKKKIKGRRGASDIRERAVRVEGGLLAKSCPLTSHTTSTLCLFGQLSNPALNSLYIAVFASLISLWAQISAIFWIELTVSCRKQRKAYAGASDAGELAFVVTQNTLKSPRPNLLDKIFANLYPTNIFQTLFDRYLTHMAGAPHHLLEFVCQAFEKCVKDRNTKLLSERKKGE